MRDSFSSNRFQGGVFADWLAEATAVARRLSAPRDTREDLAHETLLRVLEHPPERGSAGAWIQRICRNLHVDGWREAARVQRFDADAPTSPAARNAEESVLAREQRRVVRRALLALPRAQRRALILRFYGGWSFDRMAARLGMRAATMRTRVHRGLVALRTHVAALRVWLMPGALSLKPAIAVMIVIAAGGGPLIAQRPARSVPPALAAVAASGPANARSPESVAHRRSVAAGAVTLAPKAPSHQAEAPARAQGTTQAPIVPGVQRFDFENDVIRGDLKRPDEEGPIEGAVGAKHASLIELRRQFVPEIVKSFEDL
jgi:RNA polymerase sigma-70 factor (ECF subfamily)